MRRLEEITTGLEEMRSRGNSRSCVDPDNDWCLTFEARDSTTKGAPFWLQVQAGTLNMQYLDEDDPTSRLSEEVSGFPQDFKLLSWEPVLYATFEIPKEFSSGLAPLIDCILREYFALEPEYELSYHIEYHA
ncbi:MAG: hypothetical protein AB1705_13480 [Verrucomicrobiota bacterium]